MEFTEKIDAIIDAAIDVSCWSRDHSYPEEGTEEFMEFTDKLNALRTALRHVYPNC